MFENARAFERKNNKNTIHTRHVSRPREAIPVATSTSTWPSWNLSNRPSLNCYKNMYCSSMKHLKRKRNENLTSDKYINYITSCNIFPCIWTCGMSWSFRRSATKYDVDALLQKTIVGWGSFFCFIFSNCKTRSSAKKAHINKLELINQ